VVMKRVRAAKKRARIMKEKYAVWEAYLALVSGSLHVDRDAERVLTDLDALHRLAVIVAERAP